VSIFIISSSQVTSREQSSLGVMTICDPFAKTPKKQIEANTLAEIEAAFQATLAENEAFPMALTWHVSIRQGRKPNGFDQARRKLTGYTNLEAAPLVIREAPKRYEPSAADIARKEKADAWDAEFLAKMPVGAQAVIVAELIEDCSDSMSDYYGSRTVRRVILGFSGHKRDLFPELRKFAARFTETAHLFAADEKAEHREKYSMGAGYYLKTGGRDSDGWQVSKEKFYGEAPSCRESEWHLQNDFEAVVAPLEASGRFTISEHTHTKKGFQMHICTLIDRVERPEFEALRGKAESMGGWYSRPWAKTPSGFAFKDQGTAKSFAGLESPAPAHSKAETQAAAVMNSAPSHGVADKLEAIAASFEKAMNDAFRDRLSNTPKRARQAAERRLEGNHLERAMKAARSLAAAYRAGDVPAALIGVATKARIYELMKSEIDRRNSGYYDAGIETNRPYNPNSVQSVALWAMIGGKSDASIKADTIRKIETDLQFKNISGFFPTPAPVIAQMLDRADIQDGMIILEPSAGSGKILDAVAALPNVEAKGFEVNFTLHELLKLKGHNIEHGDFLEFPISSLFDRVLMNPPFEKGQDMAHVRRAFDWLKDGGRLVAIMSPSAFFRSDSKAQEFREWFEAVGGEVQDLPDGSFKESGTGISTVIVEIRK
jgi:hypothetical protein